MHQFLRGSLPDPNDHRVVGRYISPGTPPTILSTQLADSYGGKQAQASRNNYPQNHVPPGANNFSGIHHHGPGGSGYTSHLGSASLCLPLPTTVGHPQSSPSPNRGLSHFTTPSEAWGYIDDYKTEKWRHGDQRPTFANPKPIQHGWNDGSMAVHQFQIRYRPRSTTPPRAHGAPTLLDHCASFSPDSYPTADQPPSARVFNGETADTLCYAGYSGTRSMNDRAAGDGGAHPESSRHPTSFQRSRAGRKTKEPAGLELVPIRRPVQTQISKSDRRQDPTTLLPVIPPVTPAPSQFRIIVQTTYKCPTRQGVWKRQPPIEFGWVKLAYAVNKNYIDIPDYNDRVLNYEGVGSSISCRFEFSDHKLRTSKILTTNNKGTPEPVTKSKLAFRIAKFVERHIETIRAQEGCTSVTFESIVLRKLYHVSRASWQPELWYEVDTLDRNQA